MPRKARKWVIDCGLVVLFFVSVAVGAAETVSPGSEANELQVVISALRADNARQQIVIRNLQDSLTATKAESELLRKQWAEAQARALTLGANPADVEALSAQRKLAEAVRRLSLAEAEQSRLGEQLRRLILVLQSNGNVAAEVAALEAAETGSTWGAENGTAPTAGLASAKVLNVNVALKAVVLDIGAQHGARIGMPVVVFRGDRVVAELRIVDVRSQVSGALIENAEKGITVRAGDGARVTQTTGAELRGARRASENEILWKSKR